VWWYGTRRHRRYGREWGYDGEKRYRKGSRIEEVPRAQWIAIPVPDCGVPPEVVDAARTARSGYRKPASTGYLWQLSGGVMRCGPSLGKVEARAAPPLYNLMGFIPLILLP
jgi:hypothetical protein